MSVLLAGLDTTAPQGRFRKVLPVHEALHPDTLPACDMNGEVLPRDHGFPVRAVVPGRVGANSITVLTAAVAECVASAPRRVLSLESAVFNSADPVRGLPSVSVVGAVAWPPALTGAHPSALGSAL